jgi:dihydroflavonol-4-reductase
MNNILITGGTGFIGSRLAAELVARGYSVSILRRASSDISRIRHLDVRHCIGDVRDEQTLRAHVRGHDTVFHTAAVISFWKPNHPAMFDINVNGTRSVLNACAAEGIGRLMHTSSIAAIGHPVHNGDSADETCIFNWGPRNNGYKQSKRLAEEEVLKSVGGGLDAVIVNPAVVIGPGDTSFNGGKIIQTTARGMALFYPQGGMNVVYVDDVVNGMIAAALHGRAGERYILGGENVTHREAFTVAAEVTGRRPPFIPVPVGLVKLAASAFDCWGMLSRREPMITSELVSGAGLFNWYSSEKAVRELNYTITPFRDAVRRTYEWYRANHLL